MMDCPYHQVLRPPISDIDASAMLIEQSINVDEEVQIDPFTTFIDYAKSILYQDVGELEDISVNSPSWSWIANRILRTCLAYSSGVTPAILLSELFLAWNEQNKGRVPKKQSEHIVKLKKNHKREKLPNTVTIDSIYEKQFLSLNSVIESVILDAFILPGTNIYMLSLGDIWSSNTIDLYLHKRFYDIADHNYGILQKGREVFLTGCYLRVATGNSGRARLLPTEYFVVLLNEDEDNDALLLAAHFCSDSFSSISPSAAEQGVSYSLYARIEHIGQLEVLRKEGNLQRKQITLVDNNDMRLKFSLWGEQTLVANLLSVGSMLALCRPFISNARDSSLQKDQISLEYGTATHLYLVPIIMQKDQVCISLTQNYDQSSKVSIESNPCEGSIVSQVTLPCDFHGCVDFTNYPFQSYVEHLRDKMTGITLYGTVTDIKTSGTLSRIRIKDTTGAIWANLCFSKSWSLGRLETGHTVCISGLNSALTPQKCLELSWYENDTKASFFNISCLPAFLNTSCLHKQICLSDLSIHTSQVQVCHVWLENERCHVDISFLHTICGHLVDSTPSGDLECKFCQRICYGEVERTFHLRITLADTTSTVFAWCIGQTAAELLQISPDEFYELPEEEQMLYPSSLLREKFIVAIANSIRRDSGQSIGKDEEMVHWEITRAVKND